MLDKMNCLKKWMAIAPGVIRPKVDTYSIVSATDSCDKLAASFAIAKANLILSVNEV